MLHLISSTFVYSNLQAHLWGCNGLRHFNTNSLNDNESDILKLREERMSLSCQVREEISVRSLKSKSS